MYLPKFQLEVKMNKKLIKVVSRVIDPMIIKLYILKMAPHKNKEFHINY